MAFFTMIMGNGFAAFSVITVGIGIRFIVQGLTRGCKATWPDSRLLRYFNDLLWQLTLTFCLQLFLKQRTKHCYLKPAAGCTGDACCSHCINVSLAFLLKYCSF